MDTSKNKKENVSWNYILKLQGSKIKNDKIVRERKLIYISKAYEMIKLLKNDVGRINKKLIKNFTWRNFSKYVNFFL